MKVPKRDSFDDVARDALYAVEEVIRKGNSSALPNPPFASIEDPSLVEKNFFVEEREGLTPSESDIPPKPTLPAPAPAQTTSGSVRSTPIMRSGKV